jgi:hypothetical protein
MLRFFDPRQEIGKRRLVVPLDLRKQRLQFRFAAVAERDGDMMQYLVILLKRQTFLSRIR